MGLCYFRKGKEHQGNAGAKNGKKEEGLEPEKVSCLMMREAARGHLRAVREGQ